MGDNQIVTMSDAARMIPYSRKTLYKHINQGKISTTRFLDGGRGIYISELIRVYGSGIVPLEEVKKEKEPVTVVTGGDSSSKLDLLLKNIESLEVEVKSLREEISSQKLIEHKSELVKPTQSVKQEVNCHSSYIERMKKNLADRNKSNNK